MSALRDDRGQAIVLVAVTVLGLLMGVGLAIDTGQLYNGRRTAQEAADSAAFAGATVLYQKGCPWVTCTSTQVGVATSAATSDASLNGYATDTPTSGTTVVVTSPPSAGSFANNALCVQVQISTPVKTSLVPQSPTLTTVKATGTACAAQWNGAFALMATDTNCDSKALQESSNGTITVHSGNLYVNSCSSSAGYAQGTVKLDGGYVASFDGGASPWPSVSPGTTTTSTGTVQADPFAGTPGPSTTGLSSQTCGGPSLSPGIYTCTVSGNQAWTMSTGTYIFEGGGISLAGNSALAATNVFIYLTNSNYPSSSSCTGSCSCATFGLNGNNATTITALTTGAYAGMAIYQDPNCTGTLSIGGNGAITITGSIYAPTGTVSGNGNNAAVTATQIIASQVGVQNANFTINYSAASAYIGYLPALME